MAESEPNLVPEIHTVRRLLLSGNPHEALNLLLPYEATSFATLRIVLGECYYVLRSFGQAREEFKRALLLAPNSPKAEIMLELSTSMLELQRASTPPVLSLLLPEAETDTGDLGRLAKELSGVNSLKIATNPTNTQATPRPGSQTDEIGLVSETLAGIMAEQGKFDEARKVYIQLSRLNPDRYDYFRERMDALDALQHERTID